MKHSLFILPLALAVSCLAAQGLPQGPGENLADGALALRATTADGDSGSEAEAVKAGSTPVAPGEANHAQDEVAIRKIVADGVDAWNRSDAKTMLAHLAEDSDHINVAGKWGSGRDRIEKGVTDFFVTHRPVSLTRPIEKIRFITPEVAILVVRHKYSNDKRTWEAISTGVWHKMNGKWWIEVFQNTLIQSREEAITPANSKTDFSGDVAAVRKMVAESVDAWNRRDAKALAAHASENHDHINVIGAWRQGQAETVKAMTSALGTTRNNISSSVAKIRFITPDVAIVIVRHQYTNDEEALKSISTSVLHKMNGEWWNEAFQNTYVQPAADQTPEKKTTEPTP